MNKLIAACIIAWIFAIVGSVVIAQGPVPFSHWPVLYETATELVVKRATDDQGNLLDEMYFRIGYGPCLVVRTDEWQTLVDATPNDRYMNMRDYADSVYFSVENHPHFMRNCPNAPLELKPTWRNSRPTYYWQYDEVSGNWVRGKKSPYRIRTDVLVPCVRQNALTVDGVSTNYWRLDPQATVYDSVGDHVLADLDIDPPYGLLSVCREADTSVEDVRW